MSKLINNSIALQTIGYIKPTWYFHFLPFNNRSIFLDYRKASKDKQKIISYDDEYITEDAKLWDAAFQGLNKGVLPSPEEQLDKISSLQIVTMDLYRILRKYYKNIWVIYVFIIRLFLIGHPFKELKCFLYTRKIKRVALFKPSFEYPDYHTISSALIETSPIVSVIIPTLNRYESLSELLLDLENQKHTNYELIIIDQSDNYNKNFYKEYNLRIKLIRQEEKALWKARNRGVLEAKSDILIFLDDDSRINDDWIIHHLKCIDFFSADISAGVSFSVIGEKVPENYSFFRLADQLDTGNVLIKKEVFEKCGLFDRQFEKQRMGDGEFGLRAYLHGFKCISNPYAIRIHLKHNKGGLREMGSWDSFRPTSWTQPRPVPSVLYFWRKYWGNKAAIFSCLITIPFSLLPYRFKGNPGGHLISCLIYILLFPIVVIQVIFSWRQSTNMIKQGSIIDKL